jgi:hypothetical protein
MPAKREDPFSCCEALSGNRKFGRREGIRKTRDYAGTSVSRRHDELLA